MTYLFASLLPIDARQRAVDATYCLTRTPFNHSCPVGVAIRFVDCGIADTAPLPVTATAFITSRFGGDWKAVKHSLSVFMHAWDNGKIDKAKLADIFGVTPRVSTYRAGDRDADDRQIEQRSTDHERETVADHRPDTARVGADLAERVDDHALDGR